MMTSIKSIATVVLSAFLLVSCSQTDNREPESENSNDQSKPGWTVVIHGGAGDFDNTRYSASEEAEYMNAMKMALDSASAWLASGASALDVVTKTAVMLEDCPLFNAGKGAVFNAEGKNELDASLMDGRNREAGAVAGLRNVKNPILAARAVMEQTNHVMLSGPGAKDFAESVGLEIVPDEYFFTQKAFDAYERAILKKEAEKHGTIGCVVRDIHGDLAASTSTGGMTFKQFGRVGDSPIIGAGTYADNATCAVSCTGHGEFFIRVGVAREIAARMEHRNESLQAAANSVIQGKLKEMGGTGGAIAVDTEGNFVMEFNTSGMFRGFAKSSGETGVFMYR
jgi:L-asparaginase / beta-aspartyl-peptidase